MTTQTPETNVEDEPRHALPEGLIGEDKALPMSRPPAHPPRNNPSIAPSSALLMKPIAHFSLRIPSLLATCLLAGVELFAAPPSIAPLRQTVSGGVFDPEAALHFSTRTNQVLKGGGDPTSELVVWDLATGTIRETHLLPAAPSQPAIDRDRKLIAIAGGPGNRHSTKPFVSVFDYERGQFVFQSQALKLPLPREVGIHTRPRFDGNGNVVLESRPARKDGMRYVVHWNRKPPAIRETPLRNIPPGRDPRIPPEFQRLGILDECDDLLFGTGGFWSKSLQAPAFSLGARDVKIEACGMSSDGSRLVCYVVENRWSRDPENPPATHLMWWDFRTMKAGARFNLPGEGFYGANNFTIDADATQCLFTSSQWTGPIQNKRPVSRLLGIDLATGGITEPALPREGDRILDVVSPTRLVLGREPNKRLVYDLEENRVIREMAGTAGEGRSFLAMDTTEFFWNNYSTGWGAKTGGKEAPVGLELRKAAGGTLLKRIPVGGHPQAVIPPDLRIDRLPGSRLRLLGTQRKIASGGFTHSTLWTMDLADLSAMPFKLEDPGGGMLIWSGFLKAPGGRVLAAALRSDGFFEAFDPNTATAVHREPCPEVEGWFPMFHMQTHSTSTGRFAALRRDGGLRLYSVSDEGAPIPLADIFVTSDLNWLVRDARGFYWSSPGAHRGLYLREGERTLPLSHLDLTYHRPHEVATSFAAPASTVGELRESWELRIRRHGLDRVPNPDELGALPTLAISGDVPFIAPRTSVDLEALARPSGHPLRQFHLLVNGVPVHGMDGTPIPGAVAADRDTTSPARWRFSVPLQTGMNEIESFVRDASGQDSLHWVRRTWVPAHLNAGQPDLHLLAVGVSDYQLDTLDLAFAAKDANDLATFFSGPGLGFGRARIQVFKDEDASRENILAAARSLADSRPDDYVILFFAGHGLLDAEGRYYFATHGIEPENPAERGLSYEQIQSLLDGVPARRRLVLLDTCHAGGLDPREKTRLQAGKDRLAARGVRWRAAHDAIPGQRPETSRDKRLLRDLFSDLRVGTGAQVLCAAKGVEFAFENDATRNGLFTHATLSALKNPESDENRNGRLSVDELFSRASRIVSDLTEGVQNPVLREQNAHANFPVLPFQSYRQSPERFLKEYFTHSRKHKFPVNFPDESIERLLGYFKPKVRYFGKPADRAFLRRDFAGYYGKLSTVSYDLTSLAFAPDGNAPGSIRAKYHLNFRSEAKGQAGHVNKPRTGSYPAEALLEPFGPTWRFAEMGRRRP